MTHPPISLIIPAYNAVQYLGEAIDSALAQTLRPAEIIVVDDGSTDATPDLARSYGEAVKLVSQPNAGASAARNHGLRVAAHPLISFLDNDDRWHPTKLETQAEALSGNPAALLAICKICNFWSPEIPADRRPPSDLSPGFRGGQLSSWCARRALFDRIGGFDESPQLRGFGEGTEIFLRAQQLGPEAIVRQEQLLVDRRLHRANQAAGPHHEDALLMLMRRRLQQRKASA